jgi:hypothetical protein
MMLVAGAAGLAGQGQGALFPWYAPWIQIDASDRAAMARREIVLESLPPGDDSIGLVLSSTLNASPAAFVDKVRDSERLWRGPKVPQVVRFSTPPRLEDLSSLRLDPVDVRAIPDCRPGNCALKLTAGEIERLQRVRSSAGADWEGAVQEEFRRIVFDRVATYVRSGLGAHDDYRDHAEPVRPAAVFTRLLRESPWLTERAPQLAQYLQDYPRGSLPGAESTIYWMKNTYTPKPTIQIIHTVLLPEVGGHPSAPAALVASRQVLSTHYLNGSLAISALFPDAGHPTRFYLTYVNLSAADGLGGWLSGLKRFFVLRRVRATAKEIFAVQRERLEE